MVKKWLTGFLINLLWLLSAAQAEDLFPPMLQIRDTRLKHCSRTELKAFRLIHVGNAALYLEDCKNVDNIFSNIPKQLRFVYDKAIPAKAFKEASEEYLKINLGYQYSAWEQAYNEFNSHYQDIKDGDYYDLLFETTAGLQLYLNNRLLATLKDPEQGQAYFNIWFGQEPFSEELKKNLLSS